MTHYAQRLSSGEGRDSVAGTKIQLLFELIKEKLSENVDDDDLFNENENDNLFLELIGSIEYLGPLHLVKTAEAPLCSYSTIS